MLQFIVKIQLCSGSMKISKMCGKDLIELYFLYLYSISVIFFSEIGGTFFDMFCK
jgi:hypothetical protein